MKRLIFINYMKKIFWVLCCALSVAFVACSDDKTGNNDDQWFGQPEVAAVTGTTADVVCASGLAEGVLASSNVGFTYAALDDEGALGAFADAPGTADGSILRGRLSGLAPKTTYRVYAFLDLGASRIMSPAATFTTRELNPDETVLEITSLTTLPAVAEAKVYTITYSVINPVDDDTYAQASCPEAWVHDFDYSVRGEVTFDVDANPGAERSAVITLTYPQAAPQRVTVVQRAAGTKPEPEPEAIEIELGAQDAGWPTAYSNTTVQLGDYYYALNDVAVFGSNDFIQFKRSSGSIANAEDNGPIRTIEITYTKGTGSLALYLGDQDTPQADAFGMLSSIRPANVEIEPSFSGEKVVFDCTDYDYPFFTLSNEGSACYVTQLKIVCGGSGDKPQPLPEPTFGSPTYTSLTKNSATILCDYAYTGAGTPTQAYFLYAAASGTEQRVELASAQPGQKSASLTGLAPVTRYTFRLCVVIDGKTYTSDTGAFTTFDESGKPVVATRYPGWAELVPEDVSKLNTEYFYAYHLCPDYPSSGRKARNFTTCYSKSKRCPVWVAAPLHDCYTGGVKRTNAYRNDPDIDCTQAGHWDGYTRGHMLGSNERRVTTATNRDVFYYSNIGPQVQTYFNTGGGQWNTAEDWVDKQWRNLKDTCYQVVGTYWENTSTVKDGTTIPTHYYIVLLKAKKSAGKKWVVDCSANELQTIGIMVRHKAYGKSEVVKATDFQSKGVFKSVAEIERLTGHTFFPNVPNAPKESYNPSDWNF